MPDITMCPGTGCSTKDKCYRYTATPSPYRQSHFTKAPIEGTSCEYLMIRNGWK